MELTLLTWLVLGFAAYRITRFLVIDTLLDRLRARFHVYLANKNGKLQFFWHKLLDLISCTWCIGWWVSLVIYSLYTWQCPIDFNQIQWIDIFAVAGVQGMLHALEPSDA